MSHELRTEHDPHIVRQVKSCDGREHATHRDLTDLALFYCNCGYASGWVDVSTMPQYSDFIRDHLPPGATWSWPKEATG